MSISIATGVSGLPSASTAQRVTASCAAVMAATSLLVLFGWAAEIDVLRNGFLGSVAVRPCTAIALILGAFALVQRGPWSRAASTAVLVIGLVTCAEYAFGFDLRIESAGFMEAAAAFGGPYPMRMSPQAALAAVLAGIAGVALDSSRQGSTSVGRRRSQRIAQLTAAGTAFVSLVAIVATAYEGHMFLSPGPLTPLALPAAILYLIWCIGFFAHMTDEGPAALFVARDHWGGALRRITMVAIAAPFLFGLFCLELVYDRWIDTRFAISLAIAGTTLTLIFTIVTYTGRVREEDARRDAAEDTTRRTEALYRMIVETSLEGICIADANGDLRFANRRLGQLLGVDSALLRGRSLFDFILEVQGTETYVDAPLAAQQEVRMQSADGRTLDVLCSSTTLQPRGSFSGMVIMFTDITERVAARQSLEQAYDVLNQRVSALQGVEQETTADLERAHHSLDRYEARIEELAAHLAAANSELEAFSYSVSHDLRAPLRGIAGFSRELLRSHAADLDENGRHYVERILAGADRMLQLTDDLLRLSQASRTTMRRSPVDLTVLASSVAAELRETAAPAVTIDVAPGLTAHADERLLRIVLANLIGNAVKFSARGAAPRVEVGVADAGAFFVRDNGVGFDAAQAEKIFRPFQRLQNDFEGTGIGLAIVHRIIHRHAGTIWAESAPGHGATFFFTVGTLRPNNPEALL